jgi:ATP-dependent helicase/nuclease subunit B
MDDVNVSLNSIAEARSADPLRPVTVIAPSHAAALQMRRRLADITSFAAVRFETFPRLAELMGAGHLAAAGRSPLARPIGDYLAGQVARESGEAFSGVRDLAGYARVLRQLFRRLRRGGITSTSQTGGGFPSHAAEIFRLYYRYREASAAFYDEEDLLDAAAQAVETDRAGALSDVGEIYVTPPGALTAAGTRFLEALRAKAPNFHEVADSQGQPATQRFIIAPDSASEARMVVREVIDALESGIAIHEIAVFHGADRSYGRLLRETFEAAKIPIASLPGVPLIETRAGRGVLALADLPASDFSRAAAMEFLAISPLKRFIPGEVDDIYLKTSAWDRLTREAGITRGRATWNDRLGAYIADRQMELEEHKDDENEARRRAIGYELEDATQLHTAVSQLFARLEPLREHQAAASFIDAFKAIVQEYFEPGTELDMVIEEIDQLGTVGAVGGDFSLESFTWALRANLELAFTRERGLGDGVVIAEYRAASGLGFRRAVLCGAFEGALPAGPGGDAIVEDRIWRRLKGGHPFIEDAATRIQLSRDAAKRAIAAAAGGELTWSAPSYEPGGAREYYPSPMMAEAYSAVVGRRVTASELRAEKSELTSHPGSALGSMLAGPVVDSGEASLRGAIDIVRSGESLNADHERLRSLQLIQARGSAAFTEWDGNLASVAGDIALDPQRAVSPTSLEAYGQCGYRYFGRSVLRLNVVEEPDERQMMDARDRGTLIHGVLQRFFEEQKVAGRPEPMERWTDDDEGRLLEIAREEIARATERGVTGLGIYTQHEERTILSDLRLFLRHDSLFRRATGAVPAELEQAIPETEVAGVTLRGYVDRIDRTPDRRKAWIIDYKTGGAWEADQMRKDGDYLLGGQKLQLPVYLAAAADAEEAYAMYWYITQKGGFERIDYPNTPQNRQRFEATLRAILDAIRAGSFPAIPNDEDEFRGGYQNCRFCDFDRICSRRRDLEQQAKAGDSGARAWQYVAETARGDYS